MANTLDILGDLLPLQWRGIEVPCVGNDIEGSNLLVEHNQYGVDGGDQESVCRKSYKLNFRCLFRGGLSGYKNLYPTTFRDFWNACADRSAGILQHPEFGQITCKVSSFKAVYDPRARDGADIDVVWLEHNAQDSLKLGIAPSPITYAVGLAGDLEVILSNHQTLPPFDNGTKLTLKQAVNKIKGTIELAEGKVDSILADIQVTVGALNDIVDGVASLAHPDAWAITDSAREIQNALLDLQANIGNEAGAKRRRVRIYTTATPHKLSELAALYGMALDEFVGLNPMLGGERYDIAAGTQVLAWDS